MAEVWDVAAKRRSIRRFERREIPHQAVERMLEAARLSPTARNRQPLKFAAVTNPALCGKLFPHTHWASGIPDGSAGPTEATQPAAYIVILVDKQIAQSADTDAGAAAMSVLLTAEAQGIASCWLLSVDRGDAMALLNLSEDRYALHTVVALGYPAMRSRAVPVQDDGSLTYYLEAKDDLCVPKRKPEDVLLLYR